MLVTGRIRVSDFRENAAASAMMMVPCPTSTVSTARAATAP